MPRSAMLSELPVPSRRNDQRLQHWLYEPIRDAYGSVSSNRAFGCHPAGRSLSSTGLRGALSWQRWNVWLRKGSCKRVPVPELSLPKRSPITPRRRAAKFPKRVLALPDGDYPTQSPLPAAAFRANQPALDRFPWQLWHRVSAKARARLSVRALMNQPPSGFEPLRQEIARHMSAYRGLRVSADQVKVFSGMQQAIGVAACTLADPGEGVVVEEPGYTSAADAFAFGGLKVIRVPVDDQGLDVAAARNRGHGARIVYLTPARQAPLGTAMTLARRLDLLRCEC